ncbi:hypothetical protein G4B88_028601 [Cannabis sativa]|uniref:Zinc knuckle CX2CX4HX4C domain-containing protein n=1 Tax=Cannabis sativa TaxID=3483 RepID=A0A7J6F222_CANSA|nr:hypothetical protein G4B88_028601 [Cannabis sativa]
MKLCKENGDWIWANFQYEYLPTFCFVCGIIGHSERFCPKRFDQPLELVNKPYGIGMKAQMKKKSYLIGAQWLRTEKDDGGVDGGDNVSRRMGDRGGQSIQPRIMEIDRIDPGANCDPMNLGKNKGIMGSNDAIVNKKDSPRDQINMAGSEEETINEEDLLVVLDSKRRRLLNEILRLDTKSKSTCKQKIYVIDNILYTEINPLDMDIWDFTD